MKENNLCECGGELVHNGGGRTMCKVCGKTARARIVPQSKGKETATILDYEALRDYLLDSLQGKKLVTVPKKIEMFKGALEEQSVLMLGDIHAGKVNEFLNPETGLTEVTYNQKKMVEEFNRLTDSIYGINYLLSHGYKIRKLNIFGVGDLVDNDLIYGGQKFFVEYGAGKQMIVLVNLLKQFIEACLTMFDEIEFTVVGGNHGRFTHARDAAPAHNNFDYLTGIMLQTMFAGNKRVKVIVSESWFYLQHIYNWKYFICHGDNTHSWMGLPYYGIVRQSKSRRTEVPYDIECIGHFHQKMEIPISSHAITLVNGSWVEKEEFAWNKFGVLSRPEQWYFGVSPKRPRTWQFPLDLLHPKTEWHGLSKKKSYKDIV